MSSGADISTLYREFTQALTDVLAEIIWLQAPDIYRLFSQVLMVHLSPR
jgi:hypothetical protein